MRTLANLLRRAADRLDPPKGYSEEITTPMTKVWSGPHTEVSGVKWIAGFPSKGTK